LEANNGDEILLVTDANGDERYTEAAQDRFNDYCEEVESVLLANNIIKVSDHEYNVLQVAIDHMIEHQVAIDHMIEHHPTECLPDVEWNDICERLEAANNIIKGST